QAERPRLPASRTPCTINTAPALPPAELARQHRVLGVLSKATRELVEHRPLGELFETILNLLFEAVTAERGAIMLLEGNPAKLQIKASRSRQGEPLTHVSRAISRKVMENRASPISALLAYPTSTNSNTILAPTN